MKRIILFFLSMILCFSLISCSAPTLSPEKDSTDSTDTTEQKEEAAPITLYKSEFIPLSASLSEGWQLFAPERLFEKNAFEGEYDEKTYSSLCREADLFYDMYAYDENANTVSVILEKSDGDIDISAYYDEQKDAIRDSYASMGFDKIEFTDSEAQIGSESYKSFNVDMSYGDTKMYQLTFSAIMDEYLVTVTVTSVREDLREGCLSWFSHAE